MAVIHAQCPLAFPSNLFMTCVPTTLRFPWRVGYIWRLPFRPLIPMAHITFAL